MAVISTLAKMIRQAKHSTIQRTQLTVSTKSNVMIPKTGDIEILIEGTGGAIRPTPSPDGTKLAYIKG